MEDDGEGGARVVVVLRQATVLIRRCLPTAVNGIPVMVRVVGEPATASAT